MLLYTHHHLCDGEYYYKELGTMGKLEQYAKRLEAKKAKARAEIEKLESLLDK